MYYRSNTKVRKDIRICIAKSINTLACQCYRAYQQHFFCLTDNLKLTCEFNTQSNFDWFIYNSHTTTNPSEHVDRCSPQASFIDEWACNNPFVYFSTGAWAVHPALNNDHSDNRTS